MAGNTVATLALAKRAEVWSAELKEILRDELVGPVSRRRYIQDPITW